MKARFFCAMMLTCFAVAGCGGQGLVKTGGMVKFEDGSPVTGGGIAFETSTYQAAGAIHSDGSYTLSSLKPGDGLPPGEYKVTVNWSESSDSGKTTYYVDPLFGDPKTTTLSAEVTKGGKSQFDFTVTKPK